MKVHKYLGYSYQEKIYQRALEMEFQKEGIKYEREREMDIFYYDGQHLGTRRVDFFVEGKVMVELKAIAELDPKDKIQITNYCRMFKLPFGLLFNFGSQSLQYHRIFNLQHPINIAWKAKNQRLDDDAA